MSAYRWNASVKNIMQPRITFVLVMVLCLVQAQHGAAAAQNSPPSVAPCTVTIPPDVDVIDGKEAYADVKPGDTLCIPAGTRPSMEIRNLRGKAGAPITIRNDGGQVHIQGGKFRYGVTLENNAYLRLTGTGVKQQCGAAYTAAQQQCGFIIAGFARAVEAVNNATDLEVDHLEATDSSEAAVKIKGDGKGVARQYVHHLYVHDIGKEGLYMGEAGNDQSLDIVRGLEVSYNLVERSGWDAINVKHTANDVQVHGNIIRDSGLLGVTNQDQGLSVGAGGSGDYYNNLIVNAFGPGLNIRTLPAGSKVYNNVVADSGGAGIYYQDGNNTQFFNNTLVNNRQGGIIGTPRAQGTAFDNVIVGSPVAINSPGVADDNNFVGTVADVKFVDAAAGDYRLQSDSPLIDQGRSSGLFPTSDRQDVTRPQGETTDLGAYEFEGVPAPSTSAEPARPTLQPLLLVVLLGIASMLLFVWRSGSSRSPRPLGIRTKPSPQYRRKHR